MTQHLIDTVMLVGGKGTRLAGIIDDRPKPMAIVAGKPFLEWLLLMLRCQGIQRVLMCTGHLSEALEAYFGNGEDVGLEIRYVQDPFPLGTGGALRNALSKTSSNRVFVLNGDSYCRADMGNLLKTHTLLGAKASLLAVRVKDCNRYGSVEISDDGMVLSFSEKSTNKYPGLINAGIYVFERETLEEIPEGKPVSLEKDFFPSLIGKGLCAVVSDGPFIDIGIPESFYRAEEVLKNEFCYFAR